MLTKIKTISCFGLNGIDVEVEVNIADKGFPGLAIVGMVSRSAEEAKERIKTAIINSDIEFPMAKITINLAPADMQKDGSGFDLPIAMGVLASAGELKMSVNDSYFFGELSLDGSTRHTKGVFLLAVAAKENGIKNIFVPRLCANEASAICGVTVYPVDSLKSLVLHCRGIKPITPLKSIDTEKLMSDVRAEYDFSEIIGQESAKRALEIAAAGGHNVLMIGPPGSGKTMLARATAGIMPNLSEGESLEVTRIFSVTGNIPAGGSLVRNRQFRNPHHTTSLVGLIGGGSIPHPGEVSLAHRGLLFLDEFPEFGRSSLEALRQPMEDGYVNISRSAGRLTFPAKFMLIAAANPCPCG